MLTKKLLKLHSQIKSKAVAIAGEDYSVHHQVYYNEFGSIASQLTDYSSGSCIGCSGIANIVELASSIAIYAMSIC